MATRSSGSCMPWVSRMSMYIGCLWAAQDGGAKVLRVPLLDNRRVGQRLAAVGARVVAMDAPANRRLVVDGPDRSPPLRQLRAAQPVRAVHGDGHRGRDGAVRDARASAPPELLPSVAVLRLGDAGRRVPGVPVCATGRGGILVCHAAPGADAPAPGTKCC